MRQGDPSDPVMREGASPVAQPVPSRELISASQVRAAVVEMGRRIRADYHGEELTVVAVLHGALLFTADLIRELDMPLRIETVSARSYRGASRTPGDLTLAFDCGPALRDRHVLVVDDILDSGRTLARLRAEIAAAGPRSLRTAVLLEKNCRRTADVRADYTGFEIPDLFVIGYGMDHDGRWRNLAGVWVLNGSSGAPPS